MLLFADLLTNFYNLIPQELPSVSINQGESILSISPASISSLISFGLRPSTLHPTLNAVPKISLTPPFKVLAKLLNFIVLAISIISSKGIFPLCLMFFSFLRSRGGSFRALMTSDDADGTTETCACRFWMVSLTVTRRPFQSPVAYKDGQLSCSEAMDWKEGKRFGTFAISSPTFLGDRPRGPIFGASEEEDPTSPPCALR